MILEHDVCTDITLQYPAALYTYSNVLYNVIMTVLILQSYINMFVCDQYANLRVSISIVNVIPVFI